MAKRREGGRDGERERGQQENRIRVAEGRRNEEGAGDRDKREHGAGWSFDIKDIKDYC